MDLNELQQKLDSLQNQKGKEKKDFTKIYWKPPVGQSKIRIVPSAYNEKHPFTELKIHYQITKPVMISPLNFGEKDPIYEFAEKLREGEYDKENYILSKKLEPKVRTFVPVIVRGEEDKGVRLWQFGKTMYQDLINLALDEEVGDYTDVSDGRDLVIETVGPESTGTSYNKSSVRVKLKTSPLSEDKEQVEKWLKEQPKPQDQFKLYSYDEMKDALSKWISPDDDNDSDNEETTPLSNLPQKEAPKQPKTKNPLESDNYIGEKPSDIDQGKKSKKDEISELFDE